MLKQIEKNNMSGLYQSLLAELPVGVIILNTDGIIQYSNELASGLIGAELNNRSWLEVLRTEIKNVSHQGNYVILRNGIKVMVSTQASKTLNGQLLLLTDVSSIKEETDSNNTLSNLQSINKLSSTLAHQLKTPLSTALVYLSTLKSKLLNQGGLLKPIDKSIEQLNVIKYLIENELTVFKSQDIKVEPIILDEMINSIVENYNDLYPNVTFNFNMLANENTLRILGHKEALTSAINNIMDNAVEASHLQGTIDINTLGLEDNVYINIIDYGEGINQFNFSKINQTFFTTKKKGSGLGLPIAKSIVEAHQGELNFTSNTEYTTFTICVPVFRNNNE